MSAEPEPPDEAPEPPEPEGRLKPMSAAALCIWAVVGLIVYFGFARCNSYLGRGIELA